MGKLVDLTGVKIGKLTVLERHGSNKHKQALWKCLCDCGGQTISLGTHISRGLTRSCGCLLKERKNNYKHGKSNRNTSPEYRTWINMKNRCNNPKSDDYKNYGGRGIFVSEEWYRFEVFLEDMGYRPSDNHSIDRIDVNGPYSKENCRWLSKLEQSRNTRSRLNEMNGIYPIYNGDKITGYRVSIGVDGKLVHLGTIKDLEEAKKARQEAEIKYWNKSS